MKQIVVALVITLTFSLIAPPQGAAQDDVHSWVVKKVWLGGSKPEEIAVSNLTEKEARKKADELNDKNDPTSTGYYYQADEESKVDESTKTGPGRIEMPGPKPGGKPGTKGPKIEGADLREGKRLVAWSLDLKGRKDAWGKSLREHNANPPPQNDRAAALAYNEEGRRINRERDAMNADVDRCNADWLRFLKRLGVSPTDKAKSMEIYNWLKEELEKE